MIFIILFLFCFIMSVAFIEERLDSSIKLLLLILIGGGRLLWQDFGRVI